VVGDDIDHIVVLTRPDEEGVYIVDSTVSVEELDTPDFPSIYHWFLTALGPLSGST
jgi:hypothetical protein